VRESRAPDLAFAAIRGLMAHSGIGFGPVKEQHAAREMPHTSEIINAVSRIERIPARQIAQQAVKKSLTIGN